MAKRTSSVFVQVNKNRRIKEYSEEGHCWISVRLTDEMEFTHTDVEIMAFVVNAIQNKRDKLTDCSLYKPGNRYISLAVRESMDFDLLWYEAEKKASFILTQIKANKIRLSRKLLFGPDYDEEEDEQCDDGDDKLDRFDGLYRMMEYMFD
jgi:uncharacterized protein YaiE (UPF0345 family)